MHPTPAIVRHAASVIKATFNKQEILRSKKTIDLLFERGRSVIQSPLKMIFLPAPAKQEFPAQALFVVPKRAFRKAHDRNRIRRRMKESYRLNKHALYDSLGVKETNLAIAFIYISSKEEAYAVINEQLVRLLARITK